MTAAPYTSRAYAPRLRPRVRREHVLALLGICLPIPICAASGLTLPLPATVERIAASLVPWAEGDPMGANEALRAGLGGTILPGTDEGAPIMVSRSVLPAAAAAPAVGGHKIAVPGPGRTDAWPESRDDPVPDVPGASAPERAPGAEGHAGPAEGNEPVQTAPHKPADGSPSAPTPSPAPPPSSSTPSQPSPTEPAPTAPDPTLGSVVDEVVAPVKPVVDEVIAPVAPVVDDTTEAVEDTLEPVTNVLPGLGK